MASTHKSFAAKTKGKVSVGGTKPSCIKNRSSVDYPKLAAGIIQSNGDCWEKLPAGLYVISTPIGNLGDITLRALITLSTVDVIACEDTRVTGKLLAYYGIKKPLLSCHDHNIEQRLPTILQHLKDGLAIGMTCDAGTPLISDPGYRIVKACREAAQPVIPIPGANAMLCALACCGLPSDRFTFVGFLPPQKTARRKALNAIKSIDGTLVFYETAPRLTAMLLDIEAVLGSQRTVAVAREMTKLFEEVRTGTCSDLVAYYTASPQIKGEITVLVAPVAKTAEVMDDSNSGDVKQLLLELLQTMSLRDAVVTAVARTGLRRMEVYALALELVDHK